MNTLAVPPRARRRTLRLRRASVGWGFAAPFGLLFTVFLVGPVMVSLAMSFTDMRSTDVRHPLAVDLAGFTNYARLFSDELFLKAAGNTALIVAMGLPLSMAAALAVAIGINSGITRFRSVFRVGYYTPVVTSIVAVAVVWRFLLQPDAGLVNSALRLVGVDGPNWLFSTTLALPVLVVMIAWRMLGFHMVIFLAGLQTIPQELYEAARMDGAGPWAQFWHVTLPSLRPTLVFSSVYGTISLLLIFEEPFVMTRGGPLNSTLTVSQYVYGQFGFGNYGYASAMSYALFVATVALSLIWFRVFRSDAGR